MLPDLVQQQQREIETLRERVRQLEEILAPSATPIYEQWQLTATEARLFAHLTTRELASKASIMAALYSDRIDEDPDDKIADVMVCKLRKKLKPFAIEIVTHWGRGYDLINRSHYAAVPQ